MSYLLCIATLCLTLSTIQSIPPKTPFTQFYWGDDFSGHEVNRENWDVIENGDRYNGELQYYRPENVNVKNGILTIRAKIEEYGGQQYTSGQLKGYKGFTYGYFEVRAKLPRGKYLWSAIWMLPEKDCAPGEYGELDILEAMGQEPYISSASATVHYGYNSDYPNSEGSGLVNKGVGDLTQGYHLYGMEWTKKKLVFYVDDKEILRVSIDRYLHLHRNGTDVFKKKGAPFDRNYTLILNLAVGGGLIEEYGGLPIDEARKTWKQPTFQIDYVKVYKRP